MHSENDVMWFVFFDVMPGDSSFYKLMTFWLLWAVSFFCEGRGRGDDSRDGGSNGENLIVSCHSIQSWWTIKGMFSFQPICLDGGNSTVFFMFTPEKLGEEISILSLFFQMAWFNHQPVFSSLRFWVGKNPIIAIDVESWGCPNSTKFRPRKSSAPLAGKTYEAWKIATQKCLKKHMFSFGSGLLQKLYIDVSNSVFAM